MTLDVLYDYYLDRQKAAVEARHRGTLVVGLLGIGMPTEMVLAVGALPIALTPGARRPTPNADIYLDDLFPFPDRDLLETALTGGFAIFDLLVLPRERQHLFYYLKELYRSGKLPTLPPLMMFDVLPSHRDVVQSYNQRQFALLKQRLERLAVVQIDADRLRSAIVRGNQVRAARRRIEQLRTDCTLRGSEALIAHGASAFMEPATYVDAVAAITVTEKPNCGAGLLVVSADPLSHPDLHHFLEECGGHVVAEDDLWGARIGLDVAESGDPFESLVTAYLAEPRSLTSYPPEWAYAWFREAVVRSSVKGVLFRVPRSDAQLGWDVPHLRRIVEAAGKSWMVIGQDIKLAETGARVRAWIQAVGRESAVSEVFA